VAGTLHAPQRWGLSSEAMCTLGARLDAFWRRLRTGFKTCTRGTRVYADDSLRGPLTMAGARHLANMARHMPGDDGPALPHCMAHAPWSGPGVCQQRQAEIPAPPALAQGSTLLLDESADEKAGTHNAGASRQDKGRRGQGDVGRVDTCLPYANAAVGLWAMVEGELCVPHAWCGPDCAQRRKELGMPEARTFATKIALGLQLVQRAKVQRLPFALRAGDALYGRDSPCRADVDTEGVW
jgi:SRSO17 transposase